MVNYLMSMKFFYITIVLIFTAFGSKAQLGIDAGLTSQRITTFNADKFNAFGTMVSGRLYGNKWYMRICFRQSLPKKFTTSGYTQFTNSNGDIDRDFIESLELKYTETAMGFGFGFSLPATASKTKPFLMMDFMQVTSRVWTDTPTEKDIYTDNLGYTINGKALNKRKVETSFPQFRLGAGFQFHVIKNLTIFNEASVNYILSTKGGVNARSYSVDLGVRLCL